MLVAQFRAAEDVTTEPVEVDVTSTATTEEFDHKPIFAPKSRGARITAPVIPEDVPLKCRFDTEDDLWRCSYESWWREPSVYSVTIMALAAFGLGFLIGTSPKLKEAVAQAKDAVPI